MKRALLIVLLTVGVAQAATSFKRFPFTQRVTTTDVVVKWAQSSGSATVSYGPKGAATMSVSEPSSSTGRHELKLTGLTPSTRYAYTVDLGGGVTASGEFSTAAMPGEPFSFIVYGDDRTNDGDHKTVVAAMDKENVDFLVQTGDVIEYPLQSEYDNFFSIEQDLLAHNVMFTTLGNHEYAYGAGMTVWKQNFYVPDNPYYSFDYGNSRFVVLDFNANTAAQATWMDGVLADASASGIQHIFAFMHHSPYDSGNHGENTDAQTNWVPVFQKYNVDMIFGGHDHDYEHGFNSTTNLRYVITGGGGAPLYPDNSNQPYQLKFESTLNYVKVSVAGAMVTVQALRPDGSEIEHFDWMTAASSSSTTSGGTTGSSAGSTSGTTGSTTSGTTSGGTTSGGTTSGGTTSTGSTGSTGGTGGTTGGSTGGTTTGASGSTSAGSTGATSGMGSGSSSGCSTTGDLGATSGFAMLLLLSLYAVRRRLG